MKDLVVIAGPTAVGKSDAAIELAKRTGGEIVSADSMQIYRGMDIGTAKVTTEEMQGIPHHLLDIADPSVEFSASDYKAAADKVIADIRSRGKLPILCGGTGFYIQAVLYGIDFSNEEIDRSYRDELEKRALTEEGRRGLVDELKEKDPASLEKIHENNIKRVIRALEYYHETGAPISAHNALMRKKEAVYDYVGFLITDDRKVLYERIDKRVERMMEEGLEAEVRALIAKGAGKTAMQAIGYKEMVEYINGNITLEQAVDSIKQGSRHYAKRQLTWFKNRENFHVIDRSTLAEPKNEIIDIMQSFI